MFPGGREKEMWNMGTHVITWMFGEKEYDNKGWDLSSGNGQPNKLSWRMPCASQNAK